MRTLTNILLGAMIAASTPSAVYAQDTTIKQIPPALPNTPPPQIFTADSTKLPACKGEMQVKIEFKDLNANEKKKPIGHAHVCDTPYGMSGWYTTDTTHHEQERKSLPSEQFPSEDQRYLFTTKRSLRLGIFNIPANVTDTMTVTNSLFVGKGNISAIGFGTALHIDGYYDRETNFLRFEFKTKILIADYDMECLGNQRYEFKCFKESAFRDSLRATRVQQQRQQRAQFSYQSQKAGLPRP